LQEAGYPPDRPQIRLDNLLNAQILYLHGDLAAILEPGLVNLAKGSGCDGFLIESSKDSGRFPSQLLDDSFSD
jgi:hypothetical protein